MNKSSGCREPNNEAGNLCKTLPVVEKFISINGEGQNAGKLAAFIRFPGCNLSCSYCDTKWANEANVPAELISVENLVRFVRESKVHYVTLTGGEPTLQSALGYLIEALLSSAKNEGKELFVEVETNGSTNLAFLCQSREKFERLYGSDQEENSVNCVRSNEADSHKAGDSKTHGNKVALSGSQLVRGASFTMDYKLPSSNEESAMNTENFSLLTEKDTVKFVVGSLEDLERMDYVIREFDLCSKTTVYVSPVFGEIEPADIVEFLKEKTLNNVTLQLQLHKIVWPHCDKGV